MDIFAHMLWAGAGAEVARRRWSVSRRQAAGAIAAAAMPDVLQSIPVVAWIIAGDAPAALILSYATAAPGTEPSMPATVALLAHHLHCTFHSALIALPLSIGALI